MGACDDHVPLHRLLHLGGLPQVGGHPLHAWLPWVLSTYRSSQVVHLHRLLHPGDNFLLLLGQLPTSEGAVLASGTLLTSWGWSGSQFV